MRRRGAGDPPTSSSKQLDVFVSFASRDRDALVPLVHELRRRGLAVWWSDDLREGRWDLQIKSKISEARRVIGIITPNAESSTRDYIFEELELARSENKLIPVIVGGRVQSFAFRGIIALLQSYFFSTIEEICKSPQFEKLVSACRGDFFPLDDKVARSEDAATRIELWYSDLERQFNLPSQIRSFSIALAVAIFEDGPFTDVENLGQSLSAALTETECAEGDAALDPQYPRRTSQLLSLLECEAVQASHPVLGVHQTIVRFQDAERAARLIQFAWSEFGSRRVSLHRWWGETADQASTEGRMRLGFAIGTLAQNSFVDLFEQVLRDWLLSDSSRRRSVADIVLSVAAFDAATAMAIRRIVEAWSERGSAAEAAAAVRLACGFTGSRIPGLAVDTLRMVIRDERRVHVDLLEVMRESLVGLMHAHASDADSSLFDLPGLIARLADWVAEEATGSTSAEGTPRDNPFPLLLFLLAVGDLPLTQGARVQGRLSLDALMAHEESARLTAVVFNAALVRFRIGSIKVREIAQSVLTRWVVRRRQHDESKTEKMESDALFRLAQLLVQHAPTTDDADRVLYIFDGLYTPESLRVSRP